MTFENPTIEGTKITIDAIQGILNQQIVEDGDNAKVIFEDTDAYIEGYVISSDKAGNFFKELIVQDKKENPTAGIRIFIDQSPLYTSYEVGRKVYIKLNGLSIGVENGMPTIGHIDGNSISVIPSFLIDDIIIRSTEVEVLTPLKIKLEDIDDAKLNLLLSIDTLQFHKSLVSEGSVFTFAAENNDEYDGERIVESCSTGRTTILSTSTFSDFRGLQLPTGQFTFQGILTKNFEGSMYNLVLNDATQLVELEETRCDPDVLNCGTPAVGDQVIFEEDFTDKRIRDLEDLGWLNINIYDGDLEYEMGSFDNNDYIQITGYNSDEPMYEVWLITPEINLDITQDETLSIDLQAAYDNGDILEIFVTDDFTESVEEATWTKLDIQVPRSSMSGFGDFINSSPIGLACLDGNVRIGFKYTGGDPKATTRYHIDNLKVKGI